MVGAVGPEVFSLPFIVNGLNVFFLINMCFLQKDDIKILSFEPLKNVASFPIIS